MIFTRALLNALLIGLAIAAPTITKRKVNFNWGSDKIKGVNIGGWLVLEPWITPSIFDKLGRNDIVDEYTLGEKLGHDAALTILREHWDSWARWEDFNKIKQSGFNLVRIPIGYWAYDTFGSPYVSGAAVYIDAAIDWARSVGLKIIIDLHGAPGSQNGFDNSGQKTSPRWGTGNTVSQTLSVLKTISSKYGQASYQDVVVGIQLLNEPLIGAVSRETVTQFYRDGFFQTRDTSDTTVILHDGFNTPSSWNNFLTPSDNNAQNAAIDHHEYQIFDLNDIKMSPAAHVQAVCSKSNNYNGADKWTFVGEWTSAMTDCAKYLNGFGVGARYDGTFTGSSYVGDCGFANDLNKWSQERKDQARMYIEAQMSAFETKTQGWIWWNFKTESAPEWDAFKLIDAGIFPQPLENRKFTFMC